MGYMMAMSACVGCGKVFSYNPYKVPSVVVEGKREPVCLSCVEAANVEREKRGLPLFSVMEGAYEAEEVA